MAKKYYAMEENHIKIFRENPTYTTTKVVNLHTWIPEGPFVQ